MLTKQIVFQRPGVAELCDAEIREPKENEVQVRLSVSSVSSGTERANLSGEINVSVFDTAETAVFPRFGGYSSAGTVEKVGSGVTGLRPGDRVALSWSTHCRIQNIAAENVFRISDRISFRDAALFHIASFPLAAIRKCRLEIGESAIVMGMGILGLSAVRLLRAAGAVPVIAVDPSPEKREKALRNGADFAFDPYAPDFAESVKGLTNGGARTAIEVTGVGKALDGVLDCMARFGRVALLGCTRHSDFSIDYYHKVHGPGITLIGAHAAARPKADSGNGWWTQADDMQTLIGLTETGRLDLSALVDEVHSPQEAPTVYERLLHEKTFPVVQFDWDSGLSLQ